MAFGGTPIFLFNPRAQRFNYVRIDGLSLGSKSIPPSPVVTNGKLRGPTIDPADPHVGQLTTAIPGPNQIGIPAAFGRGQGNWQAEDVNLFENHFQLVGDPLGIGFSVPLLVLPSPVFDDGDITMTYWGFNGGNNDNGDAPGPVRIVLQWLHTLVS